MEKKFQRRVSGARKEGWFEVLSRVERKSLLRSWHLDRMAWGKCVQMSVRKADACREACTPWWQQVQRCWVREAGGEGEGPVIREKDFSLYSQMGSLEDWADDLLGLISPGGHCDCCVACGPGCGKLFAVKDQLINTSGSVGPGVVSTLLSCAPEAQRLPWTACHVSA